MEELYLLSPTAYDDAFHTLITECKGLVIPLINEMFDEHYRGDEKIYFARNEHFINQKGGGEVKRITDTSFLVTPC